MKCYYGYYLDSNCLIVPGAWQISSSGRTLSNFCALGFPQLQLFISAQPPCHRDTMCKRHRSGTTFFRSLSPRNPDSRFQVNRHRNSADQGFRLFVSQLKVHASEGRHPTKTARAVTHPGRDKTIEQK
jgi:hypothetical protein